jgi:AcrR family transcriptional regulator
MVEPRRERIRNETSNEIMAIARKQIAEQGAVALSLRAIARDMGMTAPAIYRYFPSRDDLLTALILDTYNRLADTLEKAVSELAEDDFRGRFLAFSHAYRDWAVANPQDYMFIFTTSVPGYDAPDEVTRPAAARSMQVFIDLLRQGMQAGIIKSRVVVSPSEGLQRAIAEAEQRYGHANSTLLVGLRGWSRLHGLITLEIFNHLEPVIGDVSDLYNLEVMELLAQLGLEKGNNYD